MTSVTFWSWCQQTGIIISSILQSGMNAMDVSLIFKHDWVPVNFVLSGWSQVQYAQNVYSAIHRGLLFVLVFFHLKLRSLPILQRPKQPRLKPMLSLNFMIQQLLEQFPPVHILCRWCTKQCYWVIHLGTLCFLPGILFCVLLTHRILLIVLSDTPVASATLFYSFPISLKPLYLYYLPLFF
jgi:hypothetical protein